MKLETIYNDLIEIINDNMNATKVLKLKEKLEKAIREETCYKTSSKTRVNAIKRIASKWNDRPALTGYGICEDYKVITDSYHAVMLKDNNIPLKLVTTDINLANKVGKHNCINANYPNFKSIINFDRKIKGFADNEALLCGIEARTSSPIRIIKDENYIETGVEGEESTAIQFKDWDVPAGSKLEFLYK